MVWCGLVRDGLHGVDGRDWRGGYIEDNGVEARWIKYMESSRDKQPLQRLFDDDDDISFTSTTSQDYLVCVSVSVSVYSPNKGYLYKSHMRTSLCYVLRLPLSPSPFRGSSLCSPIHPNSTVYTPIYTTYIHPSIHATHLTAPLLQQTSRHSSRPN